jgi:hypothetical protein
MKNLRRILLLIIMTIVLQNLSAETLDARSAPFFTTYTDHNFTFKTEKNFLGAMVEVVNSNGDVIASSKLNKRKMVIDFKNLPGGSYTIRVTKNEEVKEFQYQNNNN